MSKTVALALALIAASSTAANARDNAETTECFLWFCRKVPTPAPWHHPPPKTMGAPEIDPFSAVAGLTLLAGGLAVLRGRRSKRLQTQAE